MQKTRMRWGVLAVLFFITVINYADRATISIAGSAISRDLGLNAVSMNYIFSAFEISAHMEAGLRIAKRQMPVNPIKITMETDT